MQQGVARMTHPTSKRYMKICKDVLSYFLRCPDAADSLEGVARWRLREEYIHSTLEETGLALEWLASHGYLVSEELASAEKVYHLNLSKHEEAEKFLSRRRQ
jgi:hypothetical protein